MKATATTPKMSFEEFIIYVARNYAPAWRAGQNYFNRLRQLRPDIAEGIRGTIVDPFNLDTRIGSFLHAVETAW